MVNFGRHKIRSLDTFGVSGLLSEQAQVFYSALFYPKQIGKVSDLLAARLKKSGVNEVKLRSILLLAVFHAYQSQSKQKRGFWPFSRSEPNESDPLDQPIILECGIDSEKLAIGVCFNLSKNITLDLESISDRVSKKEPKDSFEEMLVEIQNHTDRLVLKSEASSRRIELVGLLGIEGKIDLMSSQHREPMEVVLIEHTNGQAVSKPRVYIELGDLDHLQLLRETLGKNHISPSGAGEFLAPVESFSSTQEIPVGKSAITRQEADEEFKKAMASETGALQKNNEAKGEVHQKTPISTFQSYLSQLFKKIHILKSKNSANNSDEKLAGGSSQGFGAGNVQGSNLQPEEQVDFQALIQAGEMGNPNMAVRKLLAELRVGKLQRRLLGIDSELLSIRKEIANPHAIAWIEGILNAVTQERKHVHDLTVKLERNINLKEFENKKKLTDLQEELKVKESSLLLKSNALTQAKDQVTQLNVQMGRLKAANSSSEDDVNYKEKYNLANKLLDSAKEEKIQFQQKFEQFKVLNRQLLDKFKQLKEEKNLLKVENEKLKAEVVTTIPLEKMGNGAGGGSGNSSGSSQAA